MLPLDVDKKLWNQTNATILLRKYRADALADLRKRDEKNGITHASGWKVYVDGTGDDSGRMVLDVPRADLKSTGRDLRLLTQGRWAEFCSVPQDQATICADFHLEGRKDQVNRMMKAGNGIDLRTPLERAQATGAAPRPAPKRGRGRPKGSPNKPKEDEPANETSEPATPETATAET